VTVLAAEALETLAIDQEDPGCGPKGALQAGDPLSMPEIDQAASSKPRNALFDAVAEITASDPKVSAGYIGRVLRELKAAEPPYTAQEVRRLPAILAERGFTLPLTLGTVTKYIGWVRCPPPAGGGQRAPAVDFSGLERFARKGGGNDAR
jgi:hypothetical protein